MKEQYTVFIVLRWLQKRVVEWGHGVGTYHSSNFCSQKAISFIKVVIFCKVMVNCVLQAENANKLTSLKLIKVIDHSVNEHKIY